MAYDGSLKFDTEIDSSGFQKGIDSISSVAKKGLEATKTILTGAVGAIGGIGTAAIKAGMDFDAGMSKVIAISGATEEQAAQLRDMAIEMGDKTKFSAKEAADAFSYMAMAGWETGDMLEGIEGIMNLAAASGEDLATTSDIVTDALTAFGMEAREAGDFSDILAVAASNANTDVGMMGETFKYVGTVCGTMGYSAGDAAMAIGLMANAGVKSSMAGTSLNAIITRLSTDAGASSRSLGALGTLTEKLGVAFYNADGSARPLMDVLLESREAWGSLTTAEKQNYANKIAGMEAAKSWNAIMNASDENIAKLTDSLRESSGAAEEMAAIMNDNLSGQLNILGGQLVTFGIKLTESVQEPMKELAKDAQDMVTELKTAFDKDGVDGLVNAVGDVFAQIVERVAGATPDLIDAAVRLVGSFCDSIKSNPSTGDAAFNLIASLATGLISCAGDIWSTAVVLFDQLLLGLASQFPRMLEIGKEAVGQFVQSLAESAPSVLSSAVAIISTLYDGVMTALPQIANAGADILNHLAEGIASNLPTIIPTAMQALTEFSGSLRKNVGLLVDAGLNLIRTLAQSLIDNIPVFIETIPTIITNLAGIINDNAPKILMCGIELIGKLALGLLKSIPTLIANIPQIIQVIVSVFLAFNWIELGGSIVRGLVNGIKSLASAIPNAFREFCANAHGIVSNFGWSGLGKAIIQLLKNGVSSLAGLVPQSLGGIATAALNAVKNIDWWGVGINIIRGLASGIAGSAGELIEAAMSAASGLLDAVKDFFGIHSPSTVMAEQGGYLVQGMVNGIASMPEEVAEYLEQTISRVIQWGINLKNTAVTWVTNTVNSVVDYFSALPGKVWTWLIETVNRVVRWGINLKNTAVTWVTNTVNSVVNLFSQLPGKVWTWLVETVNKVSQWGTNLISTASTAASNTVNKVNEWFQQLPGKVATWLTNTIAKVKQFASDLKSKAAEAASGFVNRITDGLKGLPGQMATIGGNIVTGIWNGISAGWGWLTDKVSSLAGKLFEAAKDALGINSPSRVFADEVGRWIPPGIGIGMERAMPELQKQMEAELESLASRMQTAVAIETGGITVRTRAEAERTANKEFPRFSGDTYIDQHVAQENHYHVPVASPSEISRTQRDAARKLLGGVK